MSKTESFDRYLAVTYKCNRNCEYCYAKDLNESFSPNEISIKDFNMVLNWFENQDIDFFNFIGGEPTTHSKINTLLDMLKRKDMSICMFTNAMFKNNKIIEHGSVREFIVNYDDPATYTKQERETLMRNLSFIKKTGKNLVLFHNIDSEEKKFSHVLDAARKFDAIAVNFSISLPNPSRTNKYVDAAQLKRLAENVLSLIDACVENGIRPKLTRAVPFCMFDRYERLYIRKKANLSGTCNSSQRHFVINTDLTIFPCTILSLPSSRKINILNTPDEESIEEFYREEIHTLKWKRTTFEKCKTCRFYIRRQCQGGCLTYKLN